MILTESVHDAGDLYLSLKFPPVTFIYDTACTFVRHLNNREPEICNEIWGQFDGCFEIPNKEQKPNTVCLFYFNLQIHLYKAGIIYLAEFQGT